MVYKYSDITREIGSPGQGIQGDMWNEIRAERERVKNERLPGQEGLSDVSLTNYKIETKRLMDLAEQEVKSKYKTKLNKLVKFNAGGTAIGKPGYDQINAKLTLGEEVITMNNNIAENFRPALKDINNYGGELSLIHI